MRQAGIAQGEKFDQILAQGDGIVQGLPRGDTFDIVEGVPELAQLQRAFIVRFDRWGLFDASRHPKHIHDQYRMMGHQGPPGLGDDVGVG